MNKNQSRFKLRNETDCQPSHIFQEHSITSTLWCKGSTSAFFPLSSLPIPTLSLLIIARLFLAVAGPHWFWLSLAPRVAGSREAHLQPVASLIRDSLSQCSSAWCNRISIEGFAKEAEKLIAVTLSLSELPAWKVGREKPNSSLLCMTVIRQGKMRRTDAKRFVRHVGLEMSYQEEPSVLICRSF